ncbi:MAG: ABC transporter permease [Acidimicrobiales bacterium]|nr:ABC transporter permease [Acidimicrobiales bacterium]
MNRQRVQSALLPVVAVLVAFLIGAIVVLADGKSPVRAAEAVIKGSMANRAAIGATLEKATPLILTGLAVIVGMKAGLFNIGAQGQLLLGSIMSAYVGYRLTVLPTVVHLPLALLAGVAFGAVPAFVVGVLKAYRGVHEVIATIMMNTILVNLTDWLAGGPWMQPDQAISKTPPIQASAEIPKVADLPVGFFLAVVMAFVVWFLLSRTTLGFELGTVGANRDAAHYAGMSVKGITVLAMTLSGALAGLGGAIETQGVVGRFEPGFNRGLGFDGITIALLAKVSPRAAIPAALLIGALRASSTQLQSIAQVAPEIVDVILAVALLLVAAPMIIRWALRLRNASGVEGVNLNTGWGS